MPQGRGPGVGARGEAPLRGIGEKIMLSEEEKNASGCLVIVGLVLVSFAVGMATAPWAGFALCGVALVAIAVIGIYAGKKKGDQ